MNCLIRRLLKPFSRVPAMNTIFKLNSKIPIKKSILSSYPLFTCLSSNKPHSYNSKSFSKESSLMKMKDESKKRADKSGPKDQKSKSRRLNPVNTTCYVQILGTGMDTQDTSPSVLLFFDNTRIVFNAGEGLQRFCTEHKIKMSKIDHIFLSRVCSETAGGLPGWCIIRKPAYLFQFRYQVSEIYFSGLLLTLAGTGEKGLYVNVWGPSDLEYFVDAMKSFVPNAATVHTRCFDASFKSDMVLVDTDTESVSDQIKLIHDEVVKISAVLLQPETRTRKEDEFAIKCSDVSVLYVCELPEIKGKFDPAKAKAHGLRPGPKYRELQEGISVKSDLQDIMVHSDDVLGPSVPGPIVLLVDCPTHSHFQEILSAQYLENYYADKAEGKHKIVNCVIHLSPSSVVNSSDYQKWMSRFCGAEHIMAGHQKKNIEISVLQSSARIAARLNYLCPQFFPVPGFWSPEQPNCSNEVSDLNFCKTVSAENLLKFRLRPYAQLGLDRSCIPIKAGPNEIINDLISEIPEISDAAKHVSQLWEGDEELWVNQNIVSRCLKNITRENVEIVLLGTGSSQPSKYRNVSSIFINLFSKGSLLLDCGEGTLGQLKRRFGIQGADNAVKRLKCIWISHIHADHHTGLARILTLRRDLLKGLPHEPLIVRSCFESNYNNQLNNYPILKNLKNVIGDAGLENVISFRVEHCEEAFGVVLKGMDRVDSDGGVIPGWKIVYSGDTRPCSTLVEASRGATVLIHESLWFTKILDLVPCFSEVHGWSLWFALCNVFSP
ncbi:putative ribonuclease Z [Helianthus anomalus]